MTNMVLRLAYVLVIPCVLCGIIRQLDTTCPLICPTIYDPVCGTDGRTYSNDCVLKARRCQTPSLHMVHGGRCDSHISLRLIQLICTTPYCWPTYEPVCGSDGITYGNGCEFSNAHCYEPDLKMVHSGPCATSKPNSDLDF